MIEETLGILKSDNRHMSYAWKINDPTIKLLFDKQIISYSAGVYGAMHSDAKAVSLLRVVSLTLKPYAKKALNLFCHNTGNFILG